MGYIFDALNKAHDEQPGDGTADPRDDQAPARADTPAVADEPAASPDALSFADASIAPSTQTGAPATSSHTMPPAPAEPVQAVDDAGSSLPLTAATRGKRGNWWSRLFNKQQRGDVDDRLVSKTSPASAVSEEYRSIRTSILARHDNQRNLVHCITSATPQEGKTITCMNLGISFAELRNRKTVVVECDLRLPTFAKLLTLEPEAPGLIDYLRGDASLKDVTQTLDGTRLSIIPAGGRVSDEAVQLLSSSRMSQLIQSLRAKYDHVLIDTPPVLTLADAGILGSQSEEVLLVARMRRTPRTLVEQAVNTLTSYNAQVSGIIATDNPRSRGRGYGYKYGYRYGYGYGYGYGYTSDHTGKRKKQRSAA